MDLLVDGGITMDQSGLGVLSERIRLVILKAFSRNKVIKFALGL